MKGPVHATQELITFCEESPSKDQYLLRADLAEQACKKYFL